MNTSPSKPVDPDTDPEAAPVGETVPSSIASGAALAAAQIAATPVSETAPSSVAPGAAAVAAEASESSSETPDANRPSTAAASNVAPGAAAAAADARETSRPREAHRTNPQAMAAQPGGVLGATATAASASPHAATWPETDNPTQRHARLRHPLTWLLLLAGLYTCYFARDLIVPVLLAIFLGLCGNPFVTRLRQLWVPRWIGALTVVTGGLALLILSAGLLLPSAASWMQRAPDELREHLPKIRELARPLQEASQATESLQRMADVAPAASTSAPTMVLEQPRRNLMEILSNAPRALTSILVVLILGFFFMVYGEDLLRRVLSVLPNWRQKRDTVDILRTIQADIARYMLTLTAINTGLGLCTAVALYAIGLAPEDALFWGAVAGLLNFAPYLGPFATTLALLLVGLTAFGHLGQALLPATAFLSLHLIEGQFLTPLVLGKRMAISPVILLLWLFLWGWMWGIAGLLLAVPMLVCFKIYCSRVESMRVWAQLIEP